MGEATRLPGGLQSLTPLLGTQRGGCWKVDPKLEEHIAKGETAVAAGDVGEEAR